MTRPRPRAADGASRERRVEAMVMRAKATKGDGAAGPENLFVLPATLNGATALAQAGEAFGQCCGELQREMLDFVSARVQADLELPASLAGCRTPIEFAEVQRDWFTAAAKDYLNETGRLAEIGSTAIQDGMASWFAALRPPQAQTDDKPQAERQEARPRAA